MWSIAMGNETILFVDDERKLLDSFVRQLRKTFQVKTAVNGKEALTLLEREGPVAVIVSDMRMPIMDGIQLLEIIKKKYPNTIRIMLTGNADLKAAIGAVNSGQIFRFLTKPCSIKSLTATLTLAVKQYQLLTAERELLDKTLKGSIRMLSEILSLTNPVAFARGYRMRTIVAQLAVALKLRPLWQVEIAALLSQVGCVTVPQNILMAINRESEISEEDRKVFQCHPMVGGKLVGRIPRLEQVAGMITRQLIPWEKGRREIGSEVSDNVQTGGNLLHVAIDYDKLRDHGNDHESIMAQLYLRQGEYDPDILKMLDTIEVQTDRMKVEALAFDDILPGMVADEDIVAENGSLIIPKGQEITWAVLQELQNYISHIGIREPIRVKMSG